LFSYCVNQKVDLGGTEMAYDWELCIRMEISIYWECRYKVNSNV